MRLKREEATRERRSRVRLKREEVTCDDSRRFACSSRLPYEECCSSSLVVYGSSLVECCSSSVCTSSVALVAS